MIYEPHDDSYLLQDVLRKKVPRMLRANSDLRALEVGVGSGIQLETCRDLGVEVVNIFGVDCNVEAVRHCSDLGFNCVKSNLFSNIGGKFDLIIFNPPYLPRAEGEDSESELITTGGELGGEVINEFLLGAGEHLSEDGCVFLLVSNLSGGICWDGWNRELIASKSIFFEKLEVWELKL